ncbi:MAG TPA: 50S ribosomal protein L4 [Desulfobacterales bacterium]|nr:50S ribosomal protein L4 [Desulfobacterales bacterium]
MKVQVFALDGRPIEEIELPPVFDTELRPDVIKRAVLAVQTARLQPWGVDAMAGKRTSAETWGKGFGVSRTRRVKGTRSPAAGMGAFSPHTVGGRRAHPPKVEKVLQERINKKERRLAIRSAITATKEKKLVACRGHIVEHVVGFPMVISDEFEKLKKSSEVREVIKKLGLWNDIERANKSKRVRAGRGKMRGRKYRQGAGPLVVISEDNGIVQGARNFPGIEIVKVSKLNAEVLAPGGKPGRLTLWTKGAVQKLAGGLFA